MSSVWVCVSVCVCLWRYQWRGLGTLHLVPRMQPLGQTHLPQGWASGHISKNRVLPKVHTHHTHTHKHHLPLYAQAIYNHVVSAVIMKSYTQTHTYGYILWICTHMTTQRWIIQRTCVWIRSRNKRDKYILINKSRTGWGNRGEVCFAMRAVTVRRDTLLVQKVLHKEEGVERKEVYMIRNAIKTYYNVFFPGFLATQLLFHSSMVLIFTALNLETDWGKKRDEQLHSCWYLLAVSLHYLSVFVYYTNQELTAK